MSKLEYAPPAIEVTDGVMSDKSQDADWLRARYFEQSAEIEQLSMEIKRLRDVAIHFGQCAHLSPDRIQEAVDGK